MFIFSAKLIVSSEYIETLDIKRKEKTKIFDYVTFENSLQQWQEGPKPSDKVYVSLGKRFRHGYNSESDANILLTICSIKARTRLQMVRKEMQGCSLQLCYV